jgi:hypothetical protein
MAEIRINEGQWAAISEEERSHIVDGLRKSGALQPEDIVVGDPSVAEMTADTPLEPMWNPLEDICKAACDVAAGTALGWCTLNTAGLGLVACIAAAEAARNACRDRC